MDSTTRKFLRRRAHDLKPVVMVGKQGPDERISKALEQALVSHELVKVKFQDFHDKMDEIATSLASSLNAEVVAIIGHIAIIFRQNTDPIKQIIHIPKKMGRR
ncbi:MAG: YhbY family RNA-binding protein [Sphaerochaetaceae bacterium]|jgi:RNA-binding protein